MDQQVVFRGMRFDVVELQVQTPDGKQHKRQLVRHPGAVTIVPLVDDDRVCLLRNYRAAAGEYLWELPAGTCEPGESPLQTAQRELAEETGYQAGRLQRLCGFYTSPGIMTEWMEVFVATQLVPGTARPEAGEMLHTRILTWSEVWELVARGEIRDAKTLCALLFYERFVARR